MQDETKQRGHLSRRAFLRLAGITAATGVLVACAAPTAEQPAAEAGGGAAAPAGEGVTVTYQMFDAELTEAEIKQFQEANPGIKITREEPDATKYFAALAAGTPPDLFRLQAPQFPLLLARKVPLNLQSYIDVSDVIKVDDLASSNNY
jgi:ABC-type glycerol-3-phosphate transport system substrate-binding protein